MFMLFYWYEKCCFIGDFCVNVYLFDQ